MSLFYQGTVGTVLFLECIHYNQMKRKCKHMNENGRIKNNPMG